ncbi:MULTISPECIES: type II and III secretion system protein family protein [unclassified Sphingomonas]|uniref:type II and III secretion system protein family protein n=1 Tax=unclassified Sphingomonas TaxID=196159 RepID=UPI000830DADD
MATLSKRMIGAPAILALLASTVGTTAMPAFGQQVASTPQTVQVNTGRGRLITLAQPMSDLFVADESVADVQVRSPTQLYIFGKGPGETTVYATSKTGKVVYSATVRVGNNFDSIGQMLSLTMPDADVKATTLNGIVVLTGTVPNPDDAAEAERLVQAFVGDKTQVLTRIRTATPLQVNLQVRIAEVSRSFVKNIGVNLASADSTGGFKFGVSRGRSSASQFVPGGPIGVGNEGSDDVTVLTAPATGTALYGAGKLLGLDLLGSLDLGERNGQVITLANPNLTALSGETGTFLAGGEIPIPISQGLGAVSVEYKQYGVSLAYTPTVLSDGRISLRVRPEVSQLTAVGAVTLNGTQIPALTTRRAETTVELGSGQSFMIGGLLQNNQDNSIDKAPGLGDVPLLGSLFRSNSFQRNETELVIVITPYLVKPVDASQIVLPTDGYRSPNDAERLLLGQTSVGQTGEKRPMPSVAPSTSAAPTIGAVAPLPTGPTLPQASPSEKAINPRGKAKSAAPGFSAN